MRRVTVRDKFPREFYDELAQLVVAFGRVEYVIKLCVKSLSGEGFTKGMAHAESRGQFRRLCNRAKELATQKLPPSQAASFNILIDKALKLAQERNDNTHALWTTDQYQKPVRYRPFWNTKTKDLEWRSGQVTAQELQGIQKKMHRLFRTLDKERKSWNPSASAAP